MSENGLLFEDYNTATACTVQLKSSYSQESTQAFVIHMDGAKLLSANKG